jgi:hypothetical protein
MDTILTVEEGNTAGGYWVALNNAIVGSIAVVMDFPEDVIGCRFNNAVFTQTHWDEVADHYSAGTLDRLKE